MPLFSTGSGSRSECRRESAHERAARTGTSVDEVVEEALRRDLGFDLLDRIWEKASLSEGEALDLALEAQQASRRPRAQE